ncbi:MAG: ABC transporter ATP-binding protein [Clostridia bacterium]|nr:ABC transporter ATP-binding protein [Clostridia bacterium]
MTDPIFFSVQALSAGYSGHPVVRDISFSLRKGSILTLIGPNGAGKSTILKTISGQLSALAGTVMISGRPLSAMPGRVLAREMSLLLTDRVRPDMMTCFEVAAMGRYPYTGRFGRLTETDRHIVHETLERVHAGELADLDFLEISDGQRQRVLLARALAQEPNILILDEPTSYLDIRHKIELLDILLEEAHQRQLTIVLSLHEIDLAEKISDMVMCIRDNCVWRYGPPEEVFNQSTITSLYDIREGTYLAASGSIELGRAPGTPEIFVIGGGGYGIPFYRALARKRIPFSAGILFEHDLEYGTACALAAQVYSAPAFEPISETVFNRAAEGLLRCRAALDAGAPVRRMNQANGRLLQKAAEAGIPVWRTIHELD